MMEEQESKNLSMYMALDADVLRDLAFLDIAHSENQSVESILSGADDVFANNYYYLEALYNKVVINPTSEFKLLVNETAWREIKHFPHVREFIKKYCYVPKLNIFNVAEKNDEAADLANAYCFGYEDRETGRRIAPAMEPYAKDGYLRISRDARNMAEATRESAIFVTMNAQDYVFDKHWPMGNKVRKTRIMLINEANNYVKVINGKKYIPQPFPLHVMGNLLMQNERPLDFIVADDDFKIKASEEDLSM